jgi:hypothetical protein
MVHAIAPRAPSAPHLPTADLIALDQLIIAQPERPLTPALHIRLVETQRVFAQALPQWDWTFSAVHLRVEGRRLITRRSQALAARVELYPLEAPARWFALLAYEGAHGRELQVQAHADNPLAALVQVLERAALGA